MYDQAAVSAENLKHLHFQKTQKKHPQTLAKPGIPSSTSVTLSTFRGGLT
jgi:hypothetical protein